MNGIPETHNWNRLALPEKLHQLVDGYLTGIMPDRFEAAFYLDDYKKNLAFENLCTVRDNTRCDHRSDSDPMTITDLTMAPSARS